MYKCPFCQSTNCEDIAKYDSPHFMQSLPTNSYQEGLVEFVCNDCGIITKVDPRIYKGEEE